MRKVLGVAIIGLALAIIITPQYLNCEAQGRMLTLANGTTTPMKCFWSARAEIATGVPILAIGSMMLFVRRKESLWYLGILGIIFGVFVLLIPTSLIGVCKTTMICNTVMRPSLIVFGSLVTASFLTGLALSLRKGD
jgi:hypothetical protein